MLLAPALLAPVLLPLPADGKPLWPGARYTDTDRANAIRRGMRFLHRTAMNPKHFEEHDDDLLWCFYTIATTAADPELRGRAWRIGQERARHWRRKTGSVPADIGADTVVALVSGGLAADRLGVRDDGMKTQLAAAASRFGPRDFLHFDPTKEPPPDDVPQTCGTCENENPRGVAACRTCRTALDMTNRYEVLCDALTNTYFGQQYGVRLGGSLADVTRWLPRMRPYRGYENGANADFIPVAYAITHVVYTLNDYGAYRLKPEWLPQEYEFLRANLRHIVTANDPETMGEFLDTLKAFGLTTADPLVQVGMAFVLSRQDADGSWGDAGNRDIYHRYHSTWTAINGLMEYAWQGERVSFPDALHQAQALS
jgi:hypothetical protein